MDNDLSHMRITIWVTFAALALVILFATFPSIDLRFSALFFSPVGQPWPGREPFPEWLRDTLREGVELAALLTFLVLVGNLRLGTSQRTGWRVWAFLCGPVILCAGLLVNGVLKAMIGRARPFSVTEFGGHQLFTPPFQFSTQCYSNCSFSSGETALIASFFPAPLCACLAAPAALWAMGSWCPCRRGNHSHVRSSHRGRRAFPQRCGDVHPVFGPDDTVSVPGAGDKPPPSPLQRCCHLGRYDQPLAQWPPRHTYPRSGLVAENQGCSHPPPTAPIRVRRRLSWEFEVQHRWGGSERQDGSDSS